MIMVALVLILTGGTVSVLKMMKLGPFQEEPSVEIEEEEEEVKSIFIDMEPILIPIFQGDDVVAKVQIQLKLETRSSKKAVRIQRIMPRIADTFIKDLHAFMPRLLKKEERIDVFILKQRLKLIADRKFGKGLISDVLVQSVLDTPAQ